MEKFDTLIILLAICLYGSFTLIFLWNIYKAISSFIAYTINKQATNTEITKHNEYFQVSKIITELEIINKALKYTHNIPHQKLYQKENELKEKLIKEIQKWD